MRLLLVGLALCLFPRAAEAGELKLRGTKGSLRITGEESRYQLVDPSTAAEATLSGPGEVTVVARAIQPLNSAASTPTLQLSVDGNELLSATLPEGRSGRFTSRHDLIPGPVLTRSLRIGPGSRVLTLGCENGAMALVVNYEPDAPELMAAPLVTGPAPNAPPEPPANLKLPAPNPEPVVPLTADAPGKPTHPVWPYVTAAGAVTVGLTAAVLAGVAQSQDNAYKGAYTGPGRNGELSTARSELVAAEVLGGAAAALLIASTVGFVF